MSINSKIIINSKTFKHIHMKYLTLLCVITLTLNCSAQIIKSKDGVSLGKRSDFIASCTKGAKKELMKFNGIEIESYKYCSCVSDNLIPTINSWEMEKAVKENKIIDLFLEDENLEILMSCLEGNFEIDDDYKFEDIDNTGFQRKVSIKNCVKEVMNTLENDTIWTKELAEQYCDCAIDKLYSKGYTYEDILEIEDENSESFNEIAMPCISLVLDDNPEFKSSNTYNTDDIEGDKYRSFVPLVDYLGQGYKIKISISGVSKYYLFDTGASDLIIDRDTERELLLNGVLKREDYLGKTQYTTANKQIMEAQMVKVDNITVGDYTLSNVVISIVNEGSLLCGKSFLDKFYKWEIDKQNKVLVIYK